MTTVARSWDSGHLLGTAQFSSLDHPGRHHPHFSFHLDLCAVVVFYDTNCQKPILKKMNGIRSRVVSSHIETVNYFELVVCMGSDGC